MQNTSTCDCKWNEAYKTETWHKHFDIKNYSCKKGLFDKGVLACEKSNCLIHTITLLVIYMSLLGIISIDCYYYYKRY